MVTIGADPIGWHGNVRQEETGAASCLTTRRGDVRRGAGCRPRKAMETGGHGTRSHEARRDDGRRRQRGSRSHPNPRHQRHHQKQRLPTDTSTGRDVHLQTPHTQPPLESTREREGRGGTIIRGLRHYRRRMSRLIYISFSLLVGYYMVSFLSFARFYKLSSSSMVA